eukprot:Colp12_sorted_trinity150504_noHs@8272
MSKYKVVALDLDGTLLNKEHTISEENRRVIQRLAAEKGTKFILASGRMTPRVVPYEEMLEFDCELVTYNGGASYSKKVHGRKRLFHMPVHEPVTNKVIDFAERHNLTVQFYLNDELITIARDSTIHLTKAYEKLTGATYVFIPDYTSCRGTRPTKILFMEDEHKVRDLFERLKQEFHSSEATLILGDFFVEVLHPTVNKGTGLEGLMRALDIPLSQVVAMGDGHNDVEFLTLAGYGIAMGNAQDTLKAVANKVSEFTHDQHAVARELELLEAAGLL